MTEAKSAKPGQYLTFMLQGQCYGVPIGAVREINRVTEITPVPQTPAYVSGVMNLRGKVIPVVNLRVKFSMEHQTYTKDTCVIVVESERQVGVIVDAVRAVVDFTEAQIEPRPQLGNDSELAFVLGMGKSEGLVTILLDIAEAVQIRDLRTTENMAVKQAA